MQQVGSTIEVPNGEDENGNALTAPAVIVSNVETIALDGGANLDVVTVCAFTPYPVVIERHGVEIPAPPATTTTTTTPTA